MVNAASRYYSEAPRAGQCYLFQSPSIYDLLLYGVHLVLSALDLHSPPAYVVDAAPSSDDPFSPMFYNQFSTLSRC